MDEEIWGEFKENPTYYVSSLGRVKNITTGRVLKHWLVGEHPSVNLYQDGIRTHYAIHLLMGIVFLDYDPSRIENGESVIVYHINRIKDDNRLLNLAVGTHRDSVSNAVSRENDLPLGVYFHKAAQKYAASIKIKRRKIHLGLFATPEEAHKRYSEEVLKLKSQ